MKRLWVALFSQFAPQLVSFLIFTTIVRRYDVQEVAAYVYALNLFYIVMPALNPAFEQVVLVHLRNGGEGASAVLSSSTLVVCMISLLSSIAVILYLHLSEDSLHASTVFLAFVPALLVTPLTVVTQLLRVKDDYSSFLRALFLSIVVGASVRLLLAFTGSDLVFIALAFCIDPLVTFSYAAWRSYKLHGATLSRPKIPLMRELGRLAPMLVGYAFLGVLFVRAPTLVLARMSSATELVKYSVALQFLAVMLSIGNSLFFVVGPPISHFEVGSKELASLSRALFLLCSIMSIGFFAGTSLLAEGIAIHVFGPKAVGIGLMTAALSFVGPMQVIMNFRNMLTLKSRSFPRQLLALLLSFAFLGAMMTLTVPGYGGLGAAVSLTLAHIVCAYPASLVVPVMRSYLPDLLRCTLGFGGWRDLQRLVESEL